MDEKSTETIRVATALRRDVGSVDTAGGLVSEIQSALSGVTPNLCMLIASAHFEEEMESLAAAIHEQLKPQGFIGATGETIIHGDHEYEGQPAVALWAAHLPRTRVRTFHLDEGDLGNFEQPSDFRDYLAIPVDERPSFVLLADPFSFARGSLQLLDLLQEAYPDQPAIGGMASAADEPGQNRLVFDGQVLRTGMVGAAIWGDVVLDTVVSQGCRPIGHHMVITKAEQNVIHELGGKRPLEALTEMLQECRPRDLELARSRGLLVGRVINEHQGSFGPGDFLIRNPIGFDQASGALAINDLVRVGQTIQFHVRDGRSASEELEELLSQRSTAPSAGALLFTCNGRGTHLFSYQHHDARAVSDECGGLPLAGFSCAGEIGPVAQRNFLHGHTASIGFFRTASG